MKSILRPLAFILALLALSSFLESRAQTPAVVRITGARFTYPIVEHWIDQYSRVNPAVQIIIEPRGSQDPSLYDILIEAFEQPEEVRKNRNYSYVGRYAIVPVANSTSAFAKTYVTKGLTGQAIKQIFFHDIFADKDKEEKIPVAYTTYTRLQKAGPPIAFARHFRYEQKDIIGKGIAGSDEHLLKAILRDTTAVSYLPASVVYDRVTGGPVSGVTPIPVDLNDNGRVSDDEKIFGNRTTAIDRLSNTNPKDIHNIPTEYIHLSVDKKTVRPEALAFVTWIVEHGLGDLKEYGFLPSNRLEKQQP